VAALPFSSLVAFIAMKQLGMSANLMSLGRLAIGIGIMVDGAVVVLENVFRHLEEGADSKDMASLVYQANREVADLEVYRGSKKISRNKASRRLFVQLNVRDRDMGSVVSELQKKIPERVSMPAGYFVEYGGQFKNQRRAMQRLYIVVPVTLALIFLILFMAFGSLRHAAMIFMNVPFATIGGIVALWLSGEYLSVPAAVGFIAVFGVAVLNGNVLVAYINQMRERGTDLVDAVTTGAEHRLRPVLMTALTTIGGLSPLLWADDIGSNVQRPLAAVVVGGLVTSTLLTLVVLPAIYRWVEETFGSASSNQS
jgi:cobalt-zinc-cadmium resistance protein CzcA